MVCRQVEEVVFPRIPELLSRVVQVRINTDPNPDFEKNMAYMDALVGTSARPTYALVFPSDPDTALSSFQLPQDALTPSSIQAAFSAWLEGALKSLPNES